MRPHALAEHATIVIAESTRRLVCNLLQTACLGTGHIVEQAIGPIRSAWVQLTRGAATLNGHAMKEGDGAAMNDEDIVYVEAKADCEVLLLDLR
jgi:quercetin 2,3-dioxygenase